LKSTIKCKGVPKPVLRTINLRKLYDTCSIEKGADKYIADLLLTNSQDKTIKPMFLEVFVTHKCTDEKIASGYPIIEIKINQKEDADNAIIENAGEVVDEYLFMQSENKNALPPIEFYGFERDVPFNSYVNYGNFLITKKDNELVANCRSVICKDINNFAPEDRAFSLSVPMDEIKNIDIYEMGMAEAISLGLRVRDCSICARYKIPYWNGNGIDSRSCHLVNGTLTAKDNEGKDRHIRNPYIFQMPYKCNGFDKSKQAAVCRTYSLDRQRIQNLVRSLEKTNKLLWIDESLLPPKLKPIEKNKTTILPEQKESATNPIVYQPVRKLLTPQKCFSCPIYRPQCGHCLGAEEKGGYRYVVCDFQRPR